MSQVVVVEGDETVSVVQVPSDPPITVVTAMEVGPQGPAGPGGVSTESFDEHVQSSEAVHGIDDVADLVLDDDPRLTDDRDPTAHAHPIEDVTDLQDELDLKANAADVTTDAELTSHVADTTAVHGIADTTLLVEQDDLTAHTSDTTAVHGIADTSELAQTREGYYYTDKNTVPDDGDINAGEVFWWFEDDNTTPRVRFRGKTANGTLFEHELTPPDLTALATHEADTTNVHGITNTSDLATDAEVATAVSTHSSDTTSVHGITDTTVLATDAEVASAVSAHEADTSVHGIADTTALATDAELAAHSADTTAVHGIADTNLLATEAEADLIAAYHTGIHAADTTSVHGITDTTVLATDAEVASAVSTHEADTSVHGIADTTALATDAEVASAVSTHEADTSVHGIADTTVLATDAEVSSAISTHSSDTTSVHGITDTTVLATDAEVATAVSNHESDTTSVHGIADTTVLATDAEVASAVSTHDADTSVHGIADTTVLATDAEVASAISTHESDTSSVHGIADTTVLATDAEVAAAITTHEADTSAVHGITDARRVGVLEGGKLECWGTSRTAGTLGNVPAVGVRDNADRWSSKLAGMLGMHEVMFATAGATLCWDDNGDNGGGWVTLMHRVQRPKPATGAGNNFGYTAPPKIVTLCDWVNDMARINTGVAGATRTNTRTENMAKMCMRTLLSMMQASKIWEPVDTAAGELAYSGTASTAATNFYSATRPRPYRGAIYGSPTGGRNMVNGSVVTIPLPDDYPGSAVAPFSVVFTANPNNTGGVVTASGTGVPGKTLSMDASAWSEPVATLRYNPLIMRFSGSDLAAGAKSIVLTVSGMTGVSPACNFIRAWIECGTDKPTVLAFNTARCNPESYLFPQLTNEDCNVWNGWLSSVVSEFDSNTKLVDVDSVMGGPDTGTNSALANYITDTMHPSEWGQAEYALKAYSAITGDTYPTFGTDHPLRTKARHARAIRQDIRCEVMADTSTSVATATVTSIQLQRELKDNSGMHGGADDVSNLDRIYCVSDGLYFLQYSGGWADNTTGLRLIYPTFIKFRDSGNIQNLNYQSPSISFSGTNAFFPPAGGGSAMVEFRVGDYFVLNSYQTSGGNLNTAGYVNITKMQDL